MARLVALRWWQRHPAHAFAQTARPALARCARAHPARLVLGAAAAGSVLVLLRPWRLADRAWLWRTLLTHGAAASVLALHALQVRHAERPETATGRNSRRQR